MKLRNRWPLDLLLVAVVILGARLAWMLTNSTTGWKVHLDQWATAVANLLGVETTRLSEKTPDLQAKFWLNQVSRIKSSDDDSQVAMGEAWMLDSPQFGFIKRHIRTLKKLDFPGIAVGWRPEIDIEAIRTLTEEFESICRSECLSRIETATRLDSENVDLWRARAILSFKWTYGTLDSKPRRNDWLSILSKCAEHDPDNALYDYLAALHLWSSSAEYHSDEHGWVLKTEDSATFDHGNACLAAGLVKHDLKFAKNSYAATMAFLKASSINCLDRLTAAESRDIDSRATNLLYLIVRWQSVQVDVDKRNKNFASAAADVRKVLRISDQITEASHDSNLRTPQLILRRWGLANLKEMNDENPNVLGVEDAEKVSVDLDQVRLDLEVQEEVGKRWTAKTSKEDRKNRGGLAFLVMLMAQQFVIVALGLGLFSGFAGLIFGAASNDERVGIGGEMHILAWLVGIGGSFVLLGMCPAEIVSSRAQTLLLCGLIWVGFVLPPVGMMNFIRKWCPLPLSQLMLLTVITALPIVILFHFSLMASLCFAALASFHPAVSIFSVFVFAWTCWQSARLIAAFAHNETVSRKRKVLVLSLVLLLCLVAVPVGTALARVMSDQLEVKVWISPTLWKGAANLHLTPPELQESMSLKELKWVWAVIQWHSHQGVFAASLIAVGVLFIWSLIRQSRIFEEGSREMPRYQKRSQVRQATLVVARSCFATSLLFSLAYLGAAPTVAESEDEYHKLHYQRLVDPSQTRDEIEATATQIKLDEALMEKLGAEIAERQRKISEQVRQGDE